MSRKDQIRVNRQIRSRTVRVVGQDGSQVGIMDLNQALDLAAEAKLDLVEIAPQADPPVCRIMDYGKFKFEQSKKQKDMKQKQKTMQVKEMKFRPRIDDHDFMTKLRHIIKFLENGDKVRAFVHFRGREMAHKDIGLRLLERVVELTEEIAVVEKRPTMEGNQMSVFLIGRDQASKK